MEKEFEETRNLIKQLYKDFENIVNENPQLYIMPTSVYHVILNKIGNMENRIRHQTESLKRHLKEKQELKRQLKLYSQRCPTVRELKKEGGITQKVHNQHRSFCEPEQLKADGNSATK